MTASQFKARRKSLKMTQKDVASVLGPKTRIMHHYEKGEQNGEKFEIPKAITVACYASTLRIGSYSGPEPDKKKIEAIYLALACLFNL